LDSKAERQRRESQTGDGQRPRAGDGGPRAAGEEAPDETAAGEEAPDDGVATDETGPPEDESALLRDEITALRLERGELEDRFLRLAAEFDNYRKRTAREWQEQKQRAAAEVLREMLELSDNLERALGAAEESQSLRKGVELIYQQLQAALKRFGVEPIEAEGQSFDPTQHEAMLVVDVQDQESQRVIDVVRRGYRLHGEVLRPARVTVAR